MKGIMMLLWVIFTLSKADDHVLNELFAPVEKGQNGLADPIHNQSRLGTKDSTLPINELLEKSSKPGDPKYSNHPLPHGGWPKHSDLIPISRTHGPHNKSKKAPKSDHLTEHNSEKTQLESGLLPKTPVVAFNRTQKVNTDHPSTNPAQSNPDNHPNSRPRGQPQPQPHLVLPPHREHSARKLDPEENRPGKSSLYQSGMGISRNNSRQSILHNRRSSSLLYQLDFLKKESDFTLDTVCMSECRKEKAEREHYCYSEFAVNGIVHDIEVVRKGIRLITLMVSSDGFYKSSRLYMTPDSFFFRVGLLVLDTYKCNKPCPDLKLGSRYIIMGQIYHRKRHLPNDLLTLLGGKLKPGDGVLRSNNYAKRFNKKRHQKTQEATRSRCR